jgi:hypothetical protein
MPSDLLISVMIGLVVFVAIEIEKKIRAARAVRSEQ